MQNDNWITTKTAEQISGYDSDYIRNLIQAGRITGQKFGWQWQVSEKSLRQYMEQHPGPRKTREG